MMLHNFFLFKSYIIEPPIDHSVQEFGGYWYCYTTRLQVEESTSSRYEDLYEVDPGRLMTK